MPVSHHPSNASSRREFLHRIGLGAAAWYLLPDSVLGQGTALTPTPYGANAHYPSNRAPLPGTPYVALPLGAVQARGWLLKQLQLQRDGLTGHAEELNDWLPALKDNAWAGGKGENWEKGPYYLKGLVCLAYILEDEALKKKARVWIEGIFASARDDGSFGPADDTDWWPRMVVTYLLRDYHEATGDPRVISLLTKYAGYMARNLPQRPLGSWSKARAADQIDTFIWLYNRTGDATLLPLAQLLRTQAFDWPTVFAENNLLSDEMLSHGVNISQALKAEGVWNLLTGKPARARDFLGVNDPLEHDHGMIIGTSSGTEHVIGKSPSQGVETCSIVERMLSDETNLRIFGDPELGDNLERIAFNALSAALSDDIHQHVYYTRPNHPSARLSQDGFWNDYADGFVPAPRSGFPCCCYNLHMGWPKYVQNSWAATHDNGLAVLAYGPSQVTAQVGDGTRITLVQETAYPFEETIHFKLSTSTPVKFPLELRLPSWCAAPQITVAGQPASDLRPGTFFRIDRLWSNGDEVVLHLPMEVQATLGYLQTVSLARGPLVYSLEIEPEKKTLQSGPNGFDQFELTPRTPWNYALDINPAQLGSAVTVQQSAIPENPFVAQTTPVRLISPARRLPAWTFARNGVEAEDPPFGPVASAEPREVIQLIPFGAQFLRITQFPYIGTPPTPPSKFQDDFSQPSFADRWGLYGGGWYLETGKLCCRSQLPSKIIALGTSFTDFAYEGQVAVPAQGNAGLLLRASRLGFNVDEYNGYYAALSSAEQAVIFGKSDGRWTELKRAPAAIQSDQMYHLRVVASGPKLSVYFNQATEPLFEVEDHDFAVGAIGLRQYVPKYAIPRFAAVSAVAS